MAIQRIRAFFNLEASGGIVLALAAIAAMIIANTPLSTGMNLLFTRPLPFKSVALRLQKTPIIGSTMV